MLHTVQNKHMRCRMTAAVSHRLRGSGSTAVMMTSKVNGTTVISIPCRSETPKNIETKIGKNDYVMGPFNPAGQQRRMHQDNRLAIDVPCSSQGKYKKYLSIWHEQLQRARVQEMHVKYRVGQKSKPQTLVHIFTKYWSISKILSVLHSAGNFNKMITTDPRQLSGVATLQEFVSVLFWPTLYCKNFMSEGNNSLWQFGGSSLPSGHSTVPLQ